MKMRLVCLASVLTLAACGSHSSDNGSGSGATAYDLGDPNAPAGHRYHQRCPDDFMNDHENNVDAICNVFGDQDDLQQQQQLAQRCEQAKEAFGERHRNIQCSFDNGDGSQTLDYSDHEDHHSHHGR